MFDTLTFDTFFSAIGGAVLHFLWQGTLITLLAAGALRLLRKQTPRVRYAVSAVALAGCGASFGLTATLPLLSPPPDTTHTSTSATAPPALFDGAALQSAAPVGETAPLYLRAAALSWLLGLGVMVARLGWQSLATHGLKRLGTRAVDPHWQSVFDTLRGEYGVSSRVRLLRSTRADVPMVVGWCSPVILLPAAAFTGLTPDQLKAVLAHELAHIRRHDPLINALQAVVETLLFFHPAVWWLSAQVRHEREHCCDDLAVKTTGDPKTLARALVCLETLRSQPTASPQLALAANGAPLMERIQRILGQKHTSNRIGWRMMTGLLLAGAVSVAVFGPSAWADGEAPAVDPILLELQLAVAAEKITPEEAFESYMLLVYPGSEAEEKAEWMVEQAEEKITAAVESGDLTREEAAEKIEAVREDYRRGFAEYMFAREVLGMTDAEMAREKVVAELEAAVAAGKMTAEEAEEKLAAYDAAVAEKDAMQAELERIKRAVEAGEITEEEAEVLYRAMKEKDEADLSEVEGDAEQAEREAKDEWLRRAEAIKDRLNAGEITEAEAERLFEELKEEAAAVFDK